MKIFLIHLLFFSIILCSCNYDKKLTAENIRISSLYTSGMIIQSSPATVIRGFADPKSLLAVRIKNYARFIHTDDSGQWVVKFPEIVLNQPFSIIIEGRDTIIELNNVRAGKVVIFLGDARLGIFETLSENNCVYTDTMNLHNFWIYSFPITYGEESDLTNSSWKQADSSIYDYKSCHAIQWVHNLIPESHTPIGIIDATWPGAKLTAWLEAGTTNLPNDSSDNKTLRRLPSLYNNRVIADSVLKLKNTGYKGIQSGVTRIWFNDENWPTSDIPIDFTRKKVPPEKKVIYLRKKIYISTRYFTSDFVINLGSIRGDAEFYFNQRKIIADKTYDQYLLTIPDTLLNQWNLLCIRLFMSEVYTGIFGPYANCYNADSSFYADISQEWKYNFNEEADFPEFSIYTQEDGELYNKFIKDILAIQADQLIWYGGYNDLENPAGISDLVTGILDYFKQVNQKNILFTPFTPSEKMLYKNSAKTTVQELKLAAQKSNAKWIQDTY